MNLATARKEKGWTQRVLAKQLGVSHSTIGHYETGIREPSASQFKRLAELLGVSMDELVLKSK